MTAAAVNTVVRMHAKVSKEWKHPLFATSRVSLPNFRPLGSILYLQLALKRITYDRSKSQHPIPYLTHSESCVTFYKH